MSLSEKELLLNKYVKLARKLGKMPSIREVRKFICSGDKLARIYNNLSSLKKDALLKHPDLDVYTMPAELHTHDIEDYRLKLEEKKRKTSNGKLIKDVNNFDYIEKFAEKVFNKPLVPYKQIKENKSKTRVVTLTLSDLHFGSNIKLEETGFLQYGPTEEARRLAEVVKQTIDYKPQYRAETELVVNILGDLTHGKLHDPQDGAAMAEQNCRAIHLLGQALAHLGGAYSKVTVNCASGNHGRDLNRHKGRATSGKWDSHETVIYFALKTALKQYKNISFNIPRTPYFVYEVFGRKYFVTHGDTVLQAGNPGKVLNIKNLEFQINKINATLKDDEEIAVCIVGHTHVASVNLLNPGTTLVTNGALQPIDQFCVSIGIFEGIASQTLFEAVPGHPFGDVRFIRVTEKTDKDETLDLIINPWEGF